MTTIRFHSLLIAAIVLLTAFPQQASAQQAATDSVPQQSVGLVLSGGGAKGIAHIGVIQALEDNNIPIDYVAGTSMGAIVGGLYASGYTPDEMMAMIQSKGFSYWSTGKIDRNLTYYFSENEATPALVSLALGGRDSSDVKSILPGSLINPLPMNFAFMDLFSAYTAQCGGDFNRLFVPFRCVTSDVYRKHKIVLSRGSLGDAIRASMSFPMVFHPIEMDSVLVYDGGIYDNFPVDVMREDFAPDIMIGVNVSGPDKKPNPNDLFQQLEDMIIQNNDYSLPADEGIKIKVEVSQFGLLDFGKAREIYRYGYDKAMEMIDSIKGRVKARIPADARRLRREVFKSQTPYVRFDSVHVSGGSPAQNQYISYLFDRGHHHHGQVDTFGIADARLAYYRAITSGRLKNLVPQAVYDRADGLFTLDLKATVKDNYNVGFGGYISSATTSMLFMSAGYNTLRFNAFEANVNGWVGQSYMAGMLNAKINLRTGLPSRMHLQVVGSRQKFYENNKLFFEDNEPVFITDSELFARLNYEWAAGQRGRAFVGLGAAHLVDKFYRNNSSNFTTDSRDRSEQNLLQLIARYEYNTLDNATYPVQGSFWRVTAMGLTGNYHFDPKSKPGHPQAGGAYESHITDHRAWVQGEASGRMYFPVGRRFSFGVELDALWSTRHLLGNYNASLVDAPAFTPTPSTYTTFNSAFRANQFVAAGVVPVWRIGSMVQLRGNFHCFMPLRAIKENVATTSAYYGDWLSDPQFIGEMAAVVTLPFANVSAYGTYMSSPARNWSFGISFGLFILAPRFLR